MGIRQDFIYVADFTPSSDRMFGIGLLLDSGQKVIE